MQLDSDLLDDFNFKQMNKEELDTAKGWIDFFRKKYNIVGYLEGVEIDQNDLIYEDEKVKKKGKCEIF